MSCSKDSDEPIEPDLTGVWYVYQETFVIDGETVHTEGKEDCAAETNFEFFSDHSVVYQNFRFCNGFIETKGTYSPEINTLTMVDDGGETEFDVSYENNELRISISYPSGPSDEPYTETNILHCRKDEPQPTEWSPVVNE